MIKVFSIPLNRPSKPFSQMKSNRSVLCLHTIHRQKDINVPWVVWAKTKTIKVYFKIRKQNKQTTYFPLESFILEQ